MCANQYCWCGSSCKEQTEKKTFLLASNCDHFDACTKCMRWAAIRITRSYKLLIQELVIVSHHHLQSSLKLILKVRREKGKDAVPCGESSESGSPLYFYCRGSELISGHSAPGCCGRRRCQISVVIKSHVFYLLDLFLILLDFYLLGWDYAGGFGAGCHMLIKMSVNSDKVCSGRRGTYRLVPLWGMACLHLPAELRRL